MGVSGFGFGGKNLMQKRKKEKFVREISPLCKEYKFIIAVLCLLYICRRSREKRIWKNSSY